MVRENPRKFVQGLNLDQGLNRVNPDLLHAQLLEVLGRRIQALAPTPRDRRGCQFSLQSLLLCNKLHHQLLPFTRKIADLLQFASGICPPGQVVCSRFGFKIVILLGTTKVILSYTLKCYKLTEFE